MRPPPSSIRPNAAEAAGGTRAPLFDEYTTISKLEGYLASHHHRDVTDYVETTTTTTNNNIDGDQNVTGEGKYDKNQEVDGSDDDADDRDDEDEYDQEAIWNEMEEEMDMVTQQLESTQNQLVLAQKILKERDATIMSLEDKLRDKDKDLEDKDEEKGTLLIEIQRLQFEVDSRDNGRTRPELEQRLRKAVEFLKKDLARSQEKYEQSQSEVRSQKSKLTTLEESNIQLEERVKELESKNNYSQESLVTCRKELQESRGETANLNAELEMVREQLARVLANADEKQQGREREIANRVKEKIRLEVRNETTQEITEQTSRKIRAEMKAEKEKEISALREQFKKVFKEHAVLQKKVDDSESAVSQAHKLEQQVPILKDEISRLSSVVDSLKESHAEKLAEVETYYRTQIQTVQENAAKEKWDHASDIRKQISKERDREVQEFTHRIEALSIQTDRLLERAAAEKEEYANQVRKRVTEEKQREIQSLTDKLAELTKDSEDLLLEAAKDKEAYGNYIRQQMEEEKNREINKYSYRLEVMTSEKETLAKRVEAFDEELSWMWKEQEKNMERIKTGQSELKSAEDILFTLRRQNQNLTTLVERYKSDHEDVSKQFNDSKAHFRESMLESDDMTFRLKDQTKQLEEMLEKLQTEHSDTLNDLETMRTSLFETINSYQARIDFLTAEKAHDADSSRLSTMLASAEAERAKLSERVKELENILGQNLHIRTHLEAEILNGQLQRQEAPSVFQSREAHNRSPYIEESVNSLQCELSARNETIQELNAMLQHYKESAKASGDENAYLRQELESSIAELQSKQSEIDILMQNHAEADTESSRLKKRIDELRMTLDASNRELVKVSIDINKTQILEATLRQYEIDLKLLRGQLLEANTRLQNVEVTTHDISEVTNDEMRRSHVDCDYGSSVESGGTTKLNNEIKYLETMIEDRKVDRITRNFDGDESTMRSQHESITCNTDDEVARLRIEIENLTAEVARKESDVTEDRSLRARLQDEIVQLNLKVEELHSVLDETAAEKSRAFGLIAETQAEKGQLVERVAELENHLVSCRQELSRTSEDLEHSKEEVVSQSEEAHQLKQHVERLNLVVKTTEQNGSIDSSELESLKKRYDQSLAAQTKEIERLRAEIEKLDELLKQSQQELQETKEQAQYSRMCLEEELQETKKNAQHSRMCLEEELQEIKEHAQRSRMHLEAELRQATEGSLKQTTFRESLQSELEQYKTDNSDLKNEILHSKRLFHEALMKSEKSISDLNQQNQTLLQALNTSEQEYSEIAEKLESDNQNLHEELAETKERCHERVNELEGMLSMSRSDQERVLNELQNLEREFNETSHALKQEKSKLELEVRKLREEVISSNDEHMEVAKELQHSRRLFKEALISWRIETRDLNQQLNIWRRSENMEIDSNRDSFSIQSQQQSLPTGSQRSSTRGDESEEPMIIDYRDVRQGGINYGGNKAAGRPQQFRAFSGILEVDTRENDLMSPYGQDSSVHQSPRGRMTAFFPDMKKKCVSWKEDEWDIDESVHTNGSSSVSRTYNNRDTDMTSKGKVVRWKDTEYVETGRIFEEDPFDEDDELNVVSPLNGLQRGNRFEEHFKYEGRFSNRGGEVYLQKGSIINRGVNTSTSNVHDIDCRDDEGTVDSRIDDSSSTGGETASLRGSSLLPPRHETTTSSGMMFESSPVMISTIRQERLDDHTTSESRDDCTVQSRDSFSYSTATSHHSKRYSNSSYVGGSSSSTSSESGFERRAADRRRNESTFQKKALVFGRGPVSTLLGGGDVDDADSRDDDNITNHNEDEDDGETFVSGLSSMASSYSSIPKGRGGSSNAGRQPPTLSATESVRSRRWSSRNLVFSEQKLSGTTLTSREQQKLQQQHHGEATITTTPIEGTQGDVGDVGQQQQQQLIVAPTTTKPAPYAHTVDEEQPFDVERCLPEEDGGEDREDIDATVDVIEDVVVDDDGEVFITTHHSVGSTPKDHSVGSTSKDDDTDKNLAGSGNTTVMGVTDVGHTTE